MDVRSVADLVRLAARVGVPRESTLNVRPIIQNSMRA
jgi:hypothetical protein